MRKLILESQLSVDGYIAEPNGNTNWMIWNWGPDWNWDTELQNYHIALTKSADSILISRQMATEGFNAHWASAAESNDDARYSFAKYVTDTQKIVFSNTLTQSTPIPGGWQNTTIVNGDLVKEINKLKNSNGKNLLVYGGATLVSSLIEAQLIDEFHLIVNPIILGKGLPIFNKLNAHQRLDLVQSRFFKKGIVLLHYKLSAAH